MRSSADGSCLSLMVIDSGSRAMYMAIKLQQLPLGRARQQRGKWSAHDRIEHHLHGTLLPYF